MSLMLRNNPRLVLREEGEEGAILFNPDSGAVWFLNATATTIYQLFDRWRARSAISRILRKTYDLFGAAEEAKVNLFIDQLRQIGAINTRTVIRNAETVAQSPDSGP
jgi:hypothetical protein